MSSKKTETKKPQETAHLHLTDMHYGKRTRTFNKDIFKERLVNLGDKVKSIHSLLSHTYDFDKLVVMLGGDVNDGTDIYPTQAHHQDVSSVEDQATELSELLADWLTKQQEVWGKVQVEVVPGNHGRAGRSISEKSNWDMVTYKYLRAELRHNDKVSLVIPKSDNIFFRKFKTRGHDYLLYHGHEIKSFSNIPWYGIRNRVARWSLTKLAPMDVVYLGHNHYHGCDHFNNVKILMSGTFVTDDEWALQVLGYESSNAFWFHGVSDARPITWSFGLEV